MGNKLKLYINLNEFDTRQMYPDDTVILVAPRGYGKTTAIKDILYNKKDSFSGALGISHTEAMNGALGAFLPPACVREKFAEDDVVEFLERQKKVRNTSKPHGCVILDDCLDSKKNFDSYETVRALFLNGRHLNVMTILALQEFKGVGPTLRKNTTWYFLGEMPDYDLDRIYPEFSHIFPEKSIFRSVMLHYAQDRRWLVIKKLTTYNNKPSRNPGPMMESKPRYEKRIHESVFYYVPEQVEFKMLPPSVWKIKKEKTTTVTSSNRSEVVFGQPKPSKKTTRNLRIKPKTIKEMSEKMEID